jgi:hypothetical protein
MGFESPTISILEWTVVIISDHILSCEYLCHIPPQNKENWSVSPFLIYIGDRSASESHLRAYSI